MGHAAWLADRPAGSLVPVATAPDVPARSRVLVRTDASVTIVIREGVPSDAEALAELAARTFRETLQTDRILARSVNTNPDAAARG